MLLYEGSVINVLEDVESEDYGYDKQDFLNRDKTVWYSISAENLSSSFIRQFHEDLDLDRVVTSRQVEEDILREFADKITRFSWDHISMRYENLSPDFIIDFRTKMAPSDLIQYQIVPIKLIKHWLKREKIDLEDVITYQPITIKLINMIEKDPDLSNMFSWYDISKTRLLPKDVFEKFSHRIYKNVYCKYQELTQEFIEEYHYTLDWDEISEHQVLTPEFIIDMSQYINIERLKMNKKVNQHELEERGIYVMLALLNS